jgi:hypothetical protein
MKYFYSHLGLGDQVICNGLLRSLIKDNETYTVFVKPQFRKPVEFMYRDLNNVFYIEGDDNFVNNYIKQNNLREHLILAGFGPIHPQAKQFDDSFYLQNDVPFINRWEKFKVIRDLDREMEIFSKFNVKENEYVFIHDDDSRNFNISNEVVTSKDLKIIRPILGLTDNIFDYCYLMEHSFESHFIDSSFRLVFDSLKLRNSNIYYHLTLMNGIVKNSNTHSQSYLDFKII